MELWNEEINTKKIIAPYEVAKRKADNNSGLAEFEPLELCNNLTG